LLTFKDSVVVLDVKQENFNLTSGYRAAHGQKVYLFNPFAGDLRTHCYNPMAAIRSNAFRVADIRALAATIYPSAGKDAFWAMAARNLFLGLTLFLCESPELPRTMGELLRQSTGDGKPLAKYLTQLIEDRKRCGAPLSRNCVDPLYRFIALAKNSENTAGIIMETFQSPLSDWTNPIVDAATSHSDFSLEDIRRKQVSIYVGVTPDALDEAGFFFNVFFSQLIKLNLRQGEFKSRKDIQYRCLLLMDEFTSIGYMEIFRKSIGYIASYGLRPLTIIQSMGQVEDNPPLGYGKEGARSLVTNHACQIVYAPKEQQDAEDYSRMLGDNTVKSRSRSIAKSGNSSSESDHGRNLLLPQEIKTIGEDRQIIVCENMRPILCDKAKYYTDWAFMNRLIGLSPTLQNATKRGRLPSEDDMKMAMQGGELRADVPMLDLDAHERWVEECRQRYAVRYRVLAEKPKAIADVRQLMVADTTANLARIAAAQGKSETEVAEAICIAQFVQQEVDLMHRANAGFEMDEEKCEEAFGGIDSEMPPSGPESSPADEVSTDATSPAAQPESFDPIGQFAADYEVSADKPPPAELVVIYDDVDDQQITEADMMIFKKDSLRKKVWLLLEENNLIHWSDLADMGRDGLLAIDGAGKATVDAIEELLASRGMALSVDA